jgi:hypothetical protein
MNGSESQDLVAAALVAAQAEMPVIPFDSKNPFLKNQYASLGSVVSHTKPILHRHKLCLLQTPQSDAGSVSLRTLIVHASGQWLDGGTMTMPISEEKGKSRSQIVGSITTYLRRYAWSTVLGLYADEDTDGHRPAATNEYGEITNGETPAPAPVQSVPRGPQLLERLYAKDKELAAAGKIKLGDFVEYIRQEGLHAQWLDDIAAWDEGQTRMMKDVCLDFIARRETGCITWRQEEALKQELIRKQIAEETILESYQVTKLAELKDSQWSEAMARLRSKQSPVADAVEI